MTQIEAAWEQFWCRLEEKGALLGATRDSKEPCVEDVMRTIEQFKQSEPNEVQIAAFAEALIAMSDFAYS